MRKMLWLVGLVAILLLTPSGFAAGIICVEPPFCLAGTSPALGVSGPAGNTIFSVGLNGDGKTFEGSGTGDGYTWSYQGNTDPLVNWGFTATTPGTYHVVFFMPVVGGPFNTLRNQGSLTISDIGRGNNPTSVTDISLTGEVPAGTVIGGVTLLDSSVTAANGGFGNATFGPATVSQSFGSPPSMAAVLNFKLSDPDGDGSAAFSGQLRLTGGASSVPEPATMALFGFGLIAIAGIARRQRTKA